MVDDKAEEVSVSAAQAEDDTILPEVVGSGFNSAENSESEEESEVNDDLKDPDFDPQNEDPPTVADVRFYA